MTEGGASRASRLSSLESVALDALGAIGHAVVLTAPDGEILLWNLGAEQVYGWTEEEALGRNVRELLASDDAEVNAAISEVVSSGKTWFGDYYARTRARSAVLVHATASPVTDDEGHMVAIVNVAHDVSERRSSEQSLRREAERLRVAFETARMGSWSWNLATGIVTWDEHMELRYGLEPGTFGGSFEEFVSRVHPDDRQRTLEEVDWARTMEAELTFEHRVVWPDGSVHWLEARGRPVRDDKGEFVGMVGVGIDIDERKQLQALTTEASELRATAQLARDLLEAERIAGLGSWRWEADTNLVTLSAEMARMLGSERTMSGVEFAETLQRVAHPDDVAELERSAQEALGRRQRRYVMELRLMIDGAPRTVVHRGEILVDPDSRDLIAVRGTFQDITEQRKAETQLQDARLRLVAERRAVQVLHETLIRPSFPALESFDIAARYLAATNDSEIGGDWYDSFETPAGGVILAVGDVSGHGVTSARLMAKLRHATRAYASIDDDLSLLLRRLDSFLDQVRDDIQIATVLVARLDPASGRLELVSAGHPPPVLVRDRRAELIELTPGPPLGAPSAHDAFPSVTATLQPGSALVLFTDGLVERRTDSLDAGFSRLLQAFDAVDGDVTAERYCELAIHACLRDTEQEDDVCLLAIHRHTGPSRSSR
jgi:PAS domain S-box-containing protein